MMKTDSFKEWMLTQFDSDELKDIAQYGCLSGFSGLIYYVETTLLYQKYKDDIWEMLNEDAESFGNNILQLIASFHGANNVCNSTTFENLLVWYAAERIAFEVTDSQHQDKDN